MGVLYSVIPYDESIKEWIKTNNIDVGQIDIGRLPTFKEIERVLYETGFKVTWEVSELGYKDATIDRSDGAWTSLVIEDYVDEDSPCGFGFHKGWEEIIHIIVSYITKITGPLVVIPDTMDGIVVVHGNTIYKEKNEDSSTQPTLHPTAG